MVTKEQVIELINEWETAGSIGGDMAEAARNGAEECGDEEPESGAYNAVAFIVSEGNNLMRALNALE